MKAETILTVFEHLAEFYSGIRFKEMGTNRELCLNTEVKPVRI